MLVLSLAGSVLLGLAIVHVVTVGVLALRPEWPLRHVIASVGAGGAAAVLVGHEMLPHRSPVLLAVASAAVVLATIGCVMARPTFRPAGAAVWVSWVGVVAVGSWWSVAFLLDQHLSGLTTSLLWVGLAVVVVTLPSAVVTTREGWDVLFHGSSDSTDRGVRLPSRVPMVSVHVPCHAEPPEVVIGTLDRLAALDYPDFEVLVIDNNTTDEALWRPVQEHCAALGPRFRFLHVEGLTGAKAGALNWALPYADPRAELLAIVDADYHVEESWLSQTVGFFDDPRMGFVQAPHAYRDFDGSRFGRWANAEYSVFFASGMVALDRHRAGLTVGTMSLIRRRALNDAGGWSEWCLTEDSELAIRIHAAGYESRYLRHPYGRGLIPETFAAYRKQRFRWTFGPVQELYRHWRLFVPSWLGGRPSALTPSQKLHHANHGIDVASIGLRLPAIAVGALAAASMVLHHESITTPAELWVAATVLLLASAAMRYLLYVRAVGAGAREAISGTVAFAGLSLVIAIASLRALARRPATWQRTPKFRPRSSGITAALSARSEITAATVSLTLGLMLVLLEPVGVGTMLALGLLLQGVTLLAAPLLAIVADRDLRTPEPSQALIPALS